MLRLSSLHATRGLLACGGVGLVAGVASAASAALLAWQHRRLSSVVGTHALTLRLSSLHALRGLLACGGVGLAAGVASAASAALLS